MIKQARELILFGVAITTHMRSRVNNFENKQAKACDAHESQSVMYKREFVFQIIFYFDYILFTTKRVMVIAGRKSCMNRGHVITWVWVSPYPCVWLLSCLQFFLCAIPIVALFLVRKKRSFLIIHLSELFYFAELVGG